MMTEINHLSYSSISTYLSCARSWKFKYILKVPTPTSPELVFGSSFHDTAEAFVANHDIDLIATWTANWRRRIEGQQIDWGTDSPESFCNEGIRILSHKDVRAALSIIECGRDDTGPKIERKVVLRVPGCPVDVIGYLDMIAADSVPCDIKTSARSWTADRAANEMQALYYLAALNQSGQRVPNLAFRHIVITKTKTPQVQTFETRHTPSQLLWLFGMIREVWEAIDTGHYPPNPGGWLCSPTYCGFWNLCRGR